MSIKDPIKFCIDLFIWVAVLPLAFLIRLEDRAFIYASEMLVLGGIGLLLKIPAILLFALHHRSWHKVSTRDLTALVGAVGSVTLILFVITLNGIAGFAIPRSVPLIEGLLALFTMALARVQIRSYFESRGTTDIRRKARRVLIVGAGEAGTMLAREMLRNRSTGRIPVGFLDDDYRKRRQLFLGLSVLGGIDELPAVCRRYPVDEVLIAIPSADGRIVRRVVELARLAHLEYRIIPGIYELLSGSVSISQIREVDLEDLLRREPVRLELNQISEYLSGKTVLVTGAGGSIGSEIVRQVAGFDPESIILLGRGENSIYQIHRELKRTRPGIRIYPVITDIRDSASLTAVFEGRRPQVVFHAAAHKHVPLMESNPEQAVFNNIVGTRNLTQLALAFGVERFVNISTDKAVNPSSVMGASKRVAELVVYQASLQADDSQAFVSVRFGNVLGSRGSVIPLFKEQIRFGGPVTVTHPKMTRYFMTIPEASQLVLQAGSMADNGAVYVLDMGDPVRIVDLAYDLIRLSGLIPDQDIEVQYSGIRPGEKLFEELLTAEEGTVASRHEKIFVARRNGIPTGQSFEDLLTQLVRSAEERNPMAIHAVLAHIVPTSQFNISGGNGAIQHGTPLPSL